MHELEFLPEDYLRARFQRRIGFIRSWLLLALGLVMVLWSFQVGAWVRDANAQLQALRGTGSVVEADVKKVRRLRAEAQTYNRRLETLQALKPRVSVSRLLASLVDLLPDGVVLDGVDVETLEEPGRATVGIRGVAMDETRVTDMLRRLEESPRFERATLAESTMQDGEAGGRRAFLIEAHVAPAQEP